MIRHYKPDNTELNGILQKGSRQLFSVSASTTWDYNGLSYPPEMALDDKDTYYHSDIGDPDPNYTIEFRNFFYLQSYTFKTRHSTDVLKNFFPWKWSLYGSFNGINWTFIDNQETTALKGICYKKNFPVKYPNIFKFFKFSNFTTIEGDKYFVIRSIDFFGYHIYKSALHGGISISIFPISKLSFTFFCFFIK